MDTIQIKDKMFTVSIKEQDILKEVTRVANEIDSDLAGKNPLFLSVLNGSNRYFQSAFCPDRQLESSQNVTAQAMAMNATKASMPSKFSPKSRSRNANEAASP